MGTLSNEVIAEKQYLGREKQKKLKSSLKSLKKEF